VSALEIAARRFVALMTPWIMAIPLCSGDPQASFTVLTDAALASSVSLLAYFAIVMSKRLPLGVADNLRNGPRAVAFNALEDCLAWPTSRSRATL
jgi:hypothetical protein